MNEAVLARIKSMVAEWMGVKEEKLRPDTRLAEDVGMDGDVHRAWSDAAKAGGQ